ncbi:unnamed protein product, partial [Rotaria sp. Silwood2]
RMIIIMSGHLNEG